MQRVAVTWHNVASLVRVTQHVTSVTSYVSRCCDTQCCVTYYGTYTPCIRVIG